MTADTTPDTLGCAVYKSLRREGYYVFVLPEEGLERIPAALQKKLAPLTLSMHLELTPTRRMARQDPAALMRALREDGYYLQTPPGTPRP